MPTVMELRAALLFTSAICFASCAGSPSVSRVSQACFSAGGLCGFHDVFCSAGLTISLRKLEFGFKQATDYGESQCELVLSDCHTLDNRKACCEHNVTGDCVKESDRDLAKFINQCDGKPKCSIQVTRIEGGCDSPPGTFLVTSTYSVITYVCENRTEPSVTSSEGRATSSVTRCGEAGCVTTTLTTAGSETTGEKNAGDQHDLYRDESTLQLIVGVSVGVGSGVISLVIIAAVCWLKMRRKPPEALRQGSTNGLPYGGSRHGIGWQSGCSSTLRSHTMTSIAPSSVHSSFFFSDSLPSSSSPGSLYSVPLDLSNPSTLRRTSFLGHYLDHVAGGYADEAQDGFEGPERPGTAPHRLAGGGYPAGGKNAGRPQHDEAGGPRGGGAGPRVANGSVLDSFSYQHPQFLPQNHSSSCSPTLSEGFGNYSSHGELLAVASMMAEGKGQIAITEHSRTVFVVPPNGDVISNNNSIPTPTENNTNTNGSQFSPNSEILNGVFSIFALQSGGEARRSDKSPSNPLAVQTHESHAAATGETPCKPASPSTSGIYQNVTFPHDTLSQMGAIQSHGQAAEGEKGQTCTNPSNDKASSDQQTMKIEAQTFRGPLLAQQTHLQPLLAAIRTHQQGNTARLRHASAGRADGQSQTTQDRQGRRELQTDPPHSDSPDQVFGDKHPEEPVCSVINKPRERSGPSFKANTDARRELTRHLEPHRQTDAEHNREDLTERSAILQQTATTVSLNTGPETDAEVPTSPLGSQQETPASTSSTDCTRTPGTTTTPTEGSPRPFPKAKKTPRAFGSVDVIL